MRIAIGIFGTLLAAVAAWTLLIYLRAARHGVAGVMIRTSWAEIHITHGSIWIPTPFASSPYFGLPVWSLIAFGVLLALWGFLGIAKRKRKSPAGFPVEAPPRPPV